MNIQSAAFIMQSTSYVRSVAQGRKQLLKIRITVLLMRQSNFGINDLRQTTMNNEKVIEMNSGFDLKVEGIGICGPDCEIFEPTTYKLFADSFTAENEKKIYATRCANLPICRNALSRYLKMKELEGIQELLNADD